MNKIYIYIIFGVLLLTLRLIFNFTYDLIPGINGGYYPLQVRTLLDSGHLGFSDMPLYFYLNAFIVKIASFFTTIDTDPLIIYTSKLIDSISMPLIVIPIYLIIKDNSEIKLPKYFEISLIGFSTLSFSPLILTSDLQKNALAIPLMLFFIYYLFSFYKNKSKKHLLLSVIFIILIGLTHFGTFSISVLMLIISMACFYRAKAFFPILGISVSAMAFIYVFDSNRANRLFSIWNLLFEKPVVLQGPLPPPDLINYTFSYLLIIWGLYFIFKRKKDLSLYRINIVIILLLIVFILSFPLLDQEFAKRFSLLLFIPQIILLAFLFDFFNSPMRKMVSLLLFLISITSVSLMTGKTKPPSITQNAFQDLKNLEQYISEPDQTLIIARHGLEWWTAWQLKTKIGQDKSLTRNQFLKYKNIIVLVQLNGMNQMHPEEKSPFHEPHFPSYQKPFYVSSYFKSTELREGDLELLQKPASDHVLRN